MKSRHYIQFEVTWASPVLIMAIAGIFITMIQTLFGSYLQQWGFTMQDQDIEIDEDLPNFYKTIKLSSADEIILQSNNLKENFKVEVEDPSVIDHLNNTTMPKKAC